MHNLFKAALTVTIFSVLTRALGFLLKIVLSRALGAEILGYYQVAMSILGVLMTLVCSGIPLVVSRSVAYKKNLHDDDGAYKSVSAGLVVALLISIVLSLVIWLFPGVLSFMLTQKKSTALVLLSLPGLIASAIYCVLRSALWGERRFFAISFTEFFEQVVRIVLCFVLFSPICLPAMGLGEKAALSLSLACVASCALVIIIYFATKNRLKSPVGAFRPLLKSSTPITALRTVSSLVSSLIALIIPLRLTAYGYSSAEAMAQFGMIMGMAFPLIMIPGTLISSLAVTLVPEVSSKTDNIDKESASFNRKPLRAQVDLGVNMTILISCILIPVFLVLGEPVCEVLFGSAEAGKYVSAGAILMLPIGINQITSSMLNSVGLEVKSLINYACGAALLIGCIFFLPKYIGTYALVVGMGGMSTVSAIMNIRMLKKRDLISGGYQKYILSCLAFGAASALATRLVFVMLMRFIPTFFALAISGGIGAAFMLALYMVFDLAGIKGFIFSKFKRRVKHA